MSLRRDIKPLVILIMILSLGSLIYFYNQDKTGEGRKKGKQSPRNRNNYSRSDSRKKDNC